MTPVDITLIAIVGYNSYVGFKKGPIYIFLSIIGIFISYFIALNHYNKLQPHIIDISETMSSLIAFLGVFIISFFFITIMVHIINKSILLLKSTIFKAVVSIGAFFYLGSFLPIFANNSPESTGLRSWITKIITWIASAISSFFIAKSDVAMNLNMPSIFQFLESNKTLLFIGLFILTFIIINIVIFFINKCLLISEFSIFNYIFGIIFGSFRGIQFILLFITPLLVLNIPTLAKSNYISLISPLFFLLLEKSSLYLAIINNYISLFPTIK